MGLFKFLQNIVNDILPRELKVQTTTRLDEEGEELVGEHLHKSNLRIPNCQGAFLRHCQGSSPQSVFLPLFPALVFTLHYLQYCLYQATMWGEGGMRI